MLTAFGLVKVNSCPDKPYRRVESRRAVTLRQAFATFPLEKSRLSHSQIFHITHQTHRGLPCGVEHQEAFA
jgi:hypothetical protein